MIPGQEPQPTSLSTINLPPTPPRTLPEKPAYLNKDPAPPPKIKNKKRKRETAASSLWACVLVALPLKRKSLLPSNSVGGILAKNADEFGFSLVFTLETKATLESRREGVLGVTPI